MESLDKKITEKYPGLVVRKDLTKIVKGNAIVPTYVLEYLLGQYCATNDQASIESGIETVKNILTKHYVHRSESELIKSIIKERGRHKIIDRVTVELNDKSGCYEAVFSNLGLKKVLVETNYIKLHPKLLVGGVWCIVDMTYEYAEDAKQIPWVIDSLKPIQISHIDFEQYLKARKEFSTDEWIDMLMQSIGMNPAMFDRRRKLLQLVRLVPFCERNYNLIELGPKGTGKSHIYSEFSPHGILISGGEITVPKLFVNNATGKIGLVGYWDTVAFDEFAGKDKNVDKSLVDILKNYMANKSFSRGIETLGAEASLAFMGNTRHTLGYMLKKLDLFSPLPDKYYDTAFLDRLHFYLPGWEVDIIRGEMFTSGYGFIVDYLAEVLKKLRNYDYSDLYAAHFKLHSDISTRDRDAIHKTFSGMMKIVYPDKNASKEEIEEMLKFAVEGRRRIKDQLLKMDDTYKTVNFIYSDLKTAQEKEVETAEAQEFSRTLDVKNTFETEDVLEKTREIKKQQKLDEALILDLLQKGEGKTTEFKQSLCYNAYTGAKDQNIEFEVVKTIAAFANTNGGYLIIGVADDGTIAGIENDYGLFSKKKNIDGFKLHIDNLIKNSLSLKLHALIEDSVIKIEQKEIFAIHINPSPEPVYVNNDQFFIRGTASSEKLDMQNAHEYIRQHWD